MTKQAVKIDAPVLRFDPAALKKIASEKVFARGAAYHKEGAVEIGMLEQTRVRARILGSELYEAELKLTSGKISGHCSCPADRDFGFCKHLVATALTVNDLKPGAVKNTKSRVETIRDYLRGLEKDALVTLLMNQAESDPAILKGLELSMKAAKGKTADVFEDLKKAITTATTTRGYVDYDDAPRWIAKLEKTLNPIAPLASAAPDIALDLLDHFFERMEKALEEVDHHHDRDAGKACEKAAEIYRQSCRALKADPKALAARLFRRETETSWDFFSGVCDDYRDILGEQGLAEYKRLAKDAWNKLPSVNPNREHYDAHSTRRYALKSILDSLAEGDNDVDARIALRAKDLSSAGDYLELAALCLDNGREDEALKWAEEGLWQFKDDKWPDERLKEFTFDLYLKRGDKIKARDLIWGAFQQRPALDKFIAIKALSTDLAEEAIALLKVEAKKEKDAFKGKEKFERLVLHRGLVGYMERCSAAVVILLKILLLEKRLPEAWEIVKEYDAPDELLENLAHASEKSHPQESIKTYEILAERFVTQGNTPAYKKAAKIIGRLKTLHENAAHAAYITALAEKYKAKRNFIKLLKQAA